LPQNRERIRVLIIPHQPNRNVKVRSLELAEYLAAQPEYEVYVLSWRTRGRTHPNILAKTWFKMEENWESGSLEPRIYAKDGFNWVRLPYLLAPYPINQDFNLKQLQKFVRAHKIQAVISGNAFHFPMPQMPGMLRIYDVVDDHISPDSNPIWRRTRKFTLGELKKADHILTISHALQAELVKLGYTDSMRLPNGVDLAAFPTENREAVNAIKERYGLQNSFTISYIGNHGWWAGMDFLLEAFGRVRVHVPNSRLLIVGPGEGLPEYQRQDPDRPGVIYAGPVPPDEVSAYFQASDFGVLPFTPCPFTNNALPLKVLEYGAARKRMLATPLTELSTLRFPHVQLLERDHSLWSETLIEEALNPTPWNPAWDTTIGEYDWRCVWLPVEQILRTHFGLMDAPAV
jgi:glycosyltransferase involved in cell wall biosynthesis